MIVAIDAKAESVVIRYISSYEN